MAPAIAKLPPARRRIPHGSLFSTRGQLRSEFRNLGAFIGSEKGDNRDRQAILVYHAYRVPYCRGSQELEKER